MCLENIDIQVMIAMHLLSLLDGSTTNQPITGPSSTSPPITGPSSTSPPITDIITTLGTISTLPPTTSTGCSMDCSSLGQQCVEVPVTETTVVGICLPIIGRSCEDITCPESHGCLLQSFPERDFSIAQCVPVETLNTTQLQPTTCDTIDCAEGSVCVDLRAGSTPVMGSCISTGCTNSTGCDPGSTCTSVPTEFGLIFNSVCTPITVDAQVGTETCAESGRDCSAPFVCQEAFIDGTLVGTACSTPPLFAISCDDLTCGDGEECAVSSLPNFGTLANCASNVDSIVMFAEQIFNILEPTTVPPVTGSSSTSSPITDVFTTLPTLVTVSTLPPSLLLLHHRLVLPTVVLTAQVLVKCVKLTMESQAVCNLEYVLMNCLHFVVEPLGRVKRVMDLLCVFNRRVVTN